MIEKIGMNIRTQYSDAHSKRQKLTFLVALILNQFSLIQVKSRQRSLFNWKWFSIVSKKRLIYISLSDMPVDQTSDRCYFASTTFTCLKCSGCTTIRYEHPCTWAWAMQIQCSALLCSALMCFVLFLTFATPGNDKALLFPFNCFVFLVLHRFHFHFFGWCINQFV